MKNKYLINEAVINVKIPINQRIFKCEECGYTIDRDMNASKNCYDFIS